MRVLIVDEFFVSRALLVRSLSAYGECHEAEDGIEAISAFEEASGEKDPYDLVFLDIMFPRLDGLRVLARIRDVENRLGVNPADRVKVIMTFNLESLDCVEEAIEEGCDAYLKKPIHKLALLHEIEKLGLISLEETANN
ncbi:MAG: response regulator [Planctomycetes bacterium]|nr:response regulator [Planctomycetota bacterium]